MNNTYLNHNSKTHTDTDLVDLEPPAGLLGGVGWWCSTGGGLGRGGCTDVIIVLALAACVWLLDVVHQLRTRMRAAVMEMKRFSGGSAVSELKGKIL